MKTITCAALSADPDKVAPVSGARCRGCGKNARMRPPTAVWFLFRMAAWCPTCAEEELGGMPDETQANYNASTGQ